MTPRYFIPHRPRIFFFLVFLILGLLIHKSIPLLRLLTEDGLTDSIASTSLINDQNLPNRTQIIPKIIHQTYRTEMIPSKWAEGQQLTVQSHDDYEYMFWTDESAHNFIATNYPFHLQNYDSYPHPIQRADALRYFVLYHYGGIYLDLDISPYRYLDTLLTLPAFACLTTPTGISNDALGATRNHPFFLHVVNSLESYNHNWGFPYITVMSSTGPLFLSLLWKEWIDSGRNTRDGKVITLVSEPWVRGYGFFLNVEGRSWQGWDERVISWLERHWGVSMLIAVGVVALFVEGFCRVSGLVLERLRVIGFGGRLIHRVE